MSKPSYATYIKDRLNGFGGESQPPPYPDLVPYPGLHQKVYGDRGRARRKMPGCNGPISVRDRDAVKVDIDNLKAGAAGRVPEDLFMEPYKIAGKLGRTPGFAGPADAKAAEVLSKYIVTDMYAKAVQGMPAEDAVKWAESELKKVYV